MLNMCHRLTGRQWKYLQSPCILQTHLILFLMWKGIMGKFTPFLLPHPPILFGEKIEQPKKSVKNVKIVFPF